MKDKVRIAILLLFVTLLSVLNLKNGLIFKTTDNTERDAVYTAYETISETKNQVASEVHGVDMSSLPRHYDFSGANYVIKQTGSCPDRDANGKCTLSTPGSGIAQWRRFAGAKPFLYGHNYSTLGQLAYMRPGDTFSVRVDGVVRTYRVVTNFTLSNAVANANRDALYTSNYGGSYDITLQTCVGSSNATVRYVQAVLV
ncbi:hypothetical protein J6W91_00240 [Candidatus Saccharibacteria bacterium]|nr:hypothetical protein [Candidatus Saccharibacteria bacterium]